MRPGGNDLPLFVCALVCVTVVMIVYTRMSHARQRELRQFAASHGWTFDATAPYAAIGCSEFGCLCGRESPKALNVIGGRFNGIEFFCFDCFDFAVPKKNGRCRVASAITVVTPYTFKAITIHSGFFRGANCDMSYAGGISFESEDFNRAFFVASEDKAFAYDVVSERMMAYLMANSPWSMEISGRRMIVYQETTALEPDGYIDALAFADGFFKQLPDYLADKMRG